MSSKNVDKAMKWLEGFTQAAPSTQTMSSFASFSEGCFANYYDNRTIVTDSLNVYMSGLTSTVGLYLMEIRKKILRKIVRNPLMQLPKILKNHRFCKHFTHK